MVLLVISLALNLLVAGALLSGYFRSHRASERMSGPSYTEILPRRFIHELGEERRRELSEVLGKYRKTFRDDRRALREAAMAAAGALDAEPFDPAKARTAIEAYGERSRGLVNLGLKAANDVIDRLKPEERKALAEQIRTRATPPRPRKKTD
jgi:uncharacterized membrane protein